VILYYILGETVLGKDEWKMNPNEFYSRFDPKRTNKQGPLRLRNLYFTYLVELRALAKAAPYLKKVSHPPLLSDMCMPGV